MEIKVKSKQMTRLANALTVSRILVIPVIIWSFFLEDRYLAAHIAFWLFLVASITDYLDGKIARAFNAGSKFGQMLDPIADKLLVSVALVLLVYSTQPNGAPRADLIPVMIIICREILVSGLREFMALEKTQMPVTKLAKWKTAIQLIALVALLAAPAFLSQQITLQSIGQLSLWLASILTAYTGYVYLRATLKHIKSSK